MTDREDLAERLDGLEARFGEDTDTDVYSDGGDHLGDMVDEAREVLPPERVERMGELEAEIERTGVYAEDSTVGNPYGRELSVPMKRWMAIVFSTAEYKLEQRGL